MLVAPRRLIGLSTGIAIAIAIFAVGGLRPLAVSNPGAVAAALASVPLDAVVTGSIAPAVTASFVVPAPSVPGIIGEPLPAIIHVGTPGFEAALAMIGDDPAAAYETAKGLASEVERRTVQWAAIYYGGGKVDHESVIRFSVDAPAFSDTSVFQTRLEQALTRADAAGPEIIRILGGTMPNTVSAQIALSLAYVTDGQKQRAAGIASQIWTSEFLEKSDETRFYKRLGELLTPEDHWARAVHLMMHDRASGVERVMPFLTDAQKSLALARNAVSRNSKDAKKLLDAVDPSMQSHPVYIFSRVQRARQFDLYDDALAWLDKATGELPDAAEWWYERRTLMRQLLNAGKTDLAYRAAAGYTEGPEGRVVEAQFHAGWIALAFLSKAADAVGHFELMRANATLPDTVSQSNYWLGRAKLASGDKLGANEAFGAAARYRTVYYGLLARAELGMKGAQLRELPDETTSADDFEASEVVQAVRLLATNGHRDWAVPLLRSFAFGLDDGGQLLLAAQLAEQLDQPSLAIKIAEDADKRGIALDPVAFPKDRLPVTHVADIDHAAIYAITRQESHFQLDAVSSAGARGLMQLMPGTAKETAQKVGVPYSKTRLTTDGAYNALLGSTYLAAQLERYDGSLLLAAAAYNAGPGNANKWIKAFGDPRSADIDPVVWVEQIPVQETRTYVKRVLGNYLVYRTQLGDTDLSMIEALRSIR